VRPVCAELKFHGDPGHHAEDEVNAKNLGPEACRLMVGFIVATECQRQEHDDERRLAHGELGEQIVSGR
jgi:hypothetical protein